MLIVFGGALIVRFGASSFLPNGTNCVHHQDVPAPGVLHPFRVNGDCWAGYRIEGVRGPFYASASKESVGGDGAFYLFAGRDLADGRGFVNPFRTSDPYAQQPPLWTLVLGGTQLIGLKSVFAKKLLFAVLGSTTAVLVGIAGRQIVSDRVGIVAGTIVAVYPGFWLYERNLNAETIVFPLIAIVVILAYRYRERPGWGLAIALGIALGVLTLSRSEQVLLIPLLLVPLMLSTGDVAWMSRVGRLAAACAVIILAQAPWTLYNLDRFEKPVILSTGFGFTAQAGACNSTFYGDRLGSFDTQKCVVFAIPRRVQLRDGSVTDVLYRQRAFKYTTGHLGRLPVVIAVREARTWSLVPPGLQVSLNGQLLNAPYSVLWLQLVLYWVLLVPAVAGAVWLRRRRVALYPLLVFPITVVLSTAITFGDSRYRAPTEVTLVILAAIAIDVATKRREELHMTPVGPV
jgi:4-amino-4-deoxy-L-arabinose transferase-like glycosyltransferase